MSEHCTTCHRPRGCPECHQAWPRGVPGHVGPDGYWIDGPAPAAADPEPTGPERAFAAAVAREDECHAEWEKCAVALRQAEQQTRSVKTVVTGGRMTDGFDRPGTKRELNKLAEAEHAARERLRAAGEAVVIARQKASAATY